MNNEAASEMARFRYAVFCLSLYGFFVVARMRKNSAARGPLRPFGFASLRQPDRFATGASLLCFLCVKNKNDSLPQLRGRRVSQPIRRQTITLPVSACSAWLKHSSTSRGSLTQNQKGILMLPLSNSMPTPYGHLLWQIT